MEHFQSSLAEKGTKILKGHVARRGTKFQKKKKWVRWERARKDSTAGGAPGSGNPCHGGDRQRTGAGLNLQGKIGLKRDLSSAQKGISTVSGEENNFIGGGAGDTKVASECDVTHLGKTDA